MRDVLKKLVDPSTLSREESAQLCEQLLHADDDRLLTAALSQLHTGRITQAMALGFIDTCYAHQMKCPINKNIVDIVGTGGDGKQSLNISTAASFLIAACDVPVIKHGNRSSTSMTGSADVIEALGISLHNDAQLIQSSLDKFNYAFCYAPHFLPILKSIAVCRRLIPYPTLFNLLGPCLNPAKPASMVVGVYSPSMMQLMADILMTLNVGHALVVHGSGYDELNTLGENLVIEVCGDRQSTYTLNPVALGLPLAVSNELTGGTPEVNQQRLRDIFSGKLLDGASETIILNAAAGLYVADQVQSIKEGVELAKAVLQSGKVTDLIKTIQAQESGDA